MSAVVKVTRGTRGRSAGGGAGGGAGASAASTATATAAPSAEHITVSVRVRPLNPAEKAAGDVYSVWKWRDRSMEHLKRVKPKGEAPFMEPTGLNFTFDNVFTPEHDNAAVYDKVCGHLAESALSGYNCSVFAYGQTSTGKTHTMNGTKSQLGIIPHSVKDLFTMIEELSSKEFLLRLSYMEIYNESVNDLLCPGSTNLGVYELPNVGIYVSGLKEEVVISADEVLEHIRRGDAHRHVAHTNYNEASSRSHTVFRIIIESTERSANARKLLNAVAAGKAPRRARRRITKSTLNLIDLAGSENARSSNGQSDRRKQTKQEGSFINKSLLTLGHVIHKLSAQASSGAKSAGHIPYRDSKLTRILQPALSGNCKVAVVCTVTPAKGCQEESINTLKFGARAKRIKHIAIVNEVADADALLRKYKDEIAQLREKLRIYEEQAAVAAPPAAAPASTAGVAVAAAAAAGVSGVAPPHPPPLPPQQGAAASMTTPLRPPAVPLSAQERRRRSQSGSSLIDEAPSPYMPPRVSRRDSTLEALVRGTGEALDEESDVVVLEQAIANLSKLILNSTPSGHKQAKSRLAARRRGRGMPIKRSTRRKPRAASAGMASVVVEGDGDDSGSGAAAGSGSSGGGSVQSSAGDDEEGGAAAAEGGEGGGEVASSNSRHHDKTAAAAGGGGGGEVAPDAGVAIVGAPQIVDAASGAAVAQPLAVAESDGVDEGAGGGEGATADAVATPRLARDKSVRWATPTRDASVSPRAEEVASKLQSLQEVNASSPRTVISRARMRLSSTTSIESAATVDSYTSGSDGDSGGEGDETIAAELETIRSQLDRLVKYKSMHRIRKGAPGSGASMSGGELGNGSPGGGTSASPPARGRHTRRMSKAQAEEASRLRTALSDMQRQLVSQRLNSSVQAADSNFLQFQLKNKDDALQELNASLADVEAKHETLHAENMELKRQVLQLEAELEEAVALAEEVSAANVAATATEAGTNGHSRHSSEDFEMLQLQVQERDATIVALHKQVTELKAAAAAAAATAAAATAAAAHTNGHSSSSKPRVVSPARATRLPSALRQPRGRAVARGRPSTAKSRLARPAGGAMSRRAAPSGGIVRRVASSNKARASSTSSK